MNIQTQITPRKPTYYDRSTSIDWTVSITRNGVCLFESDCALTINYWPYEVAQVRMGDDFGYEIEEASFYDGHTGRNNYHLTPDSDALLFKLITDELNKPSEAKKLKEAIAAKIGDE
jgi:hypothetical protein